MLQSVAQKPVFTLAKAQSKDGEGEWEGVLFSCNQEWARGISSDKAGARQSSAVAGQAQRFHIHSVENGKPSMASEQGAGHTPELRRCDLARRQSETRTRKELLTQDCHSPQLW